MGMFKKVIRTYVEYERDARGDPLERLGNKSVHSTIGLAIDFLVSLQSKWFVLSEANPISEGHPVGTSSTSAFSALPLHMCERHKLNRTSHNRSNCCPAIPQARRSKGYVHHGRVLHNPNGETWQKPLRPRTARPHGKTYVAEAETWQNKLTATKCLR